MAFVCNEYNCNILCNFSTGGRQWTNFEGIVDYCASFRPEPGVSECIKYYVAMANCVLYDVPENEIDTVYIERCDSISGDFYKDFDNAVNNTAMSVFLFSVMAGILAVRAVIKVIKGAVR